MLVQKLALHDNHFVIKLRTCLFLDTLGPRKFVLITQVFLIQNAISTYGVPVFLIGGVSYPTVYKRTFTCVLVEVAGVLASRGLYTLTGTISEPSVREDL